MYGVVVEGQCVYKVRVFGCKRVMVLADAEVKIECDLCF